ncbi:MAG TPA: hypothetical protein P5548_00960 [Candidatus Moranbacteria bacterium]|nr:hypothetical protein [Candidatus Moranbacteria bacterium]HRZ33462.1 hypothetical protein [Candidatus Moranbacteria bacterium]
MRFTKKLLLPRIQRRENAKLEKFVVKSINKELKSVNLDYNLVQMQYFFESVFLNKSERKKFLKKITESKKK